MDFAARCCHPIPWLLQVKGPGSRAYKRFVAARVIQRWIKKCVGC